MIALPLIAALIPMPGLVVAMPYQLLVTDDWMAIQVAPVVGSIPEPGQRMTVDFQLSNDREVVFVDTELRGMTYSYGYGRPEVDPILGSACQMMRPGEQRLVLFGADFMPAGLGGVAPAHVSLNFWVRRS